MSPPYYKLHIIEIIFEASIFRVENLSPDFKSRIRGIVTADRISNLTLELFFLQFFWDCAWLGV